MNVAFQRNIGSFVRVVPAFGAGTVNTGNDGSATAGLTIDRHAILPVALSAAVALQFNITDLGDEETAEISITAEDSADGVTWDALDIGPPDAENVRTKVYDSESEDADLVLQVKAQLGAARRYVRFNHTITLSADSADAVSVLGGVAVLSGFDELPAADYVAPETQS